MTAGEKRNPILRSIRAGAPIPILLLLPSCASWLAPQPPTIPTPLQIRTYLESANTLANGPNVPLGVVNGVTVATNGYTLVNTECDAFFSDVFRMSFDTGFNRQEVILAGAFAAGTLAAVKASAQSIAIAALAATLLGASFENFQNFALLTPYPNQVHKLVQSAMSTYVQSAPPNDTTKMTNVETALFFVSGMQPYALMPVSVISLLKPYKRLSLLIRQKAKGPRLLPRCLLPRRLLP